MLVECFTFSVILQGVFSVPNLGTKNVYRAVTYKGGSGTSRTFEKKMADAFTSSQDEKIATDGSCAILCLKKGLENCDSFIIRDNNGELTCKMGIGGTGGGNVEIYTVPLDERPTTSTTTTTSTTISTTNPTTAPTPLSSGL